MIVQNLKNVMQGLKTAKELFRTLVKVVGVNDESKGKKNKD